MPDTGFSRRNFVKFAAIGAGALSFGPGFWGEALALGPRVAAGSSVYGPLGLPDANGVRLPAGFTSRVVARTGEPVAGTGYVWHEAPDGGATFRLGDNGWVYVSNSEVWGTGGAGMIRFDAAGNITDAGRILDATSRNCAGGPTPWGTWLSCEEIGNGLVWECDPLGQRAAVARPGLGACNHEAAAVDLQTGIVYLTEDRYDAGLYRFRPYRQGRLDAGVLEVLVDADTASGLAWAAVPDPSAATVELRYQVPTTHRFARTEGIWFDRGRLYLATTADNRVWSLEPLTNRLELLYDNPTSANPILTGVDNVTVSRGGDVFVAEDGGDMQLVVLRNGAVAPFLQIVGQDGSEITGPAFSPDGFRLYVSSQRPGTTYEITGPFRRGLGHHYPYSQAARRSLRMNVTSSPAKAATR
jgi:secreted PhoX family phosphatase